MKIYLDVCCLNRPFDDQSQTRVRLEAEAILLVLAHFQSGEWQWLSSEVIDDEIAQTRDPNRRNRVQNLLLHAHDYLMLTEKEIARGSKLAEMGFGSTDALHLACAESGQADVFLSTDDKLVQKAAHLAKQLQVLVANPLEWLMN